jgi:hypothetical protein
MPPIRIQCAYALKDPLFLENMPLTVFDAVFQQRTTADYLTCKMTQISIQTVRWPASRFVSAVDDPFAVTSAVQRSMVDATIWVSPLCTSRSGKVPEVCMPTFTAASCYPYCMAARLQASSSQSLVLYSANEWRERVHLMNRDCSMMSMTAEDLVRLSQQGSMMFLPNGTSSASASKGGQESTSETTSPTTPVDGSSVLITNPAAVLGCIQSPMSQTMLGKDVLQRLAPSRANNAFRSILMPGQPFAYAGQYQSIFCSVFHVQASRVPLEELYLVQIVHLLHLRHKIKQEMSPSPLSGEAMESMQWQWTASMAVRTMNSPWSMFSRTFQPTHQQIHPR